MSTFLSSGEIDEDLNEVYDEYDPLFWPLPRKDVNELMLAIFSGCDIRIVACAHDHNGSRDWLVYGFAGSGLGIIYSLHRYDEEKFVFLYFRDEFCPYARISWHESRP